MNDMDNPLVENGRLRHIVYSTDDIRRRVASWDARSRGLQRRGRCPWFLGMLKAQSCPDLVRRSPSPSTSNFSFAGSYGKQMTSSGEVRLFYNPRTSLAGRNVILVEDIIDSGNTLLRVIPLLLQGEPASLEICTLLHKRLTRLPKDARWVGFEAPEEFLAGYGLVLARIFGTFLISGPCRPSPGNEKKTGMSDQNPTPSEPPKKLKRVSRTASFWLLLALTSMIAFQFMRGGERSVGRISPSELYRQLENGNILEVTFLGESEVRGEFKTTIEIDEANVNEFVTNIVPGAAPDLAEQLRAQEVEVDARPKPPGWLPMVGTFLPWLLIIVFWIWILRSMQAGGNRAFQFGRSKARLISPDTPQVTFADVAGAEEAKDELEEIIEFLKDPPRFSRLGGRLPKGVLLVGHRHRKHCWPARWPARLRAPSSRCPAPTLWRCSSAWGRHGCATCLSRGRRTPRASSSWTRSTPWGDTAGPGWAVATTSVSKR